MSWRLREAAKPFLARRHSPLNRFYFPAALGVAFLNVELPRATLAIFWALCSGLALFYYIKRRSPESKKVEQASVISEKVAFGGAPYFAAASFLVSLVGYPRLAILVFMALYAFVNFIILGSALAILSERLCRLIFNPELKPVKHALINSLALPLSFLVSLAAALPWLLAVPGSSHVLLTRAYTVGGASINFSRLFFIVMLFLLLRSLRSLGVTSLAHLPDTMPQLERGVIPPLQILFTYALWTAFALTSLSLLGVDFTSLAVVAGGLSVGIGFGLQNLFNNLISGFTIILGRSVLVGDWVEVGGISGTVRNVNIRCTEVETAENATVFVPNSSFMSNQFVNWTRNHRMCRKKLEFRVVYGVDIELVLNLLRQSAETIETVAKTPAPLAAVTDFSEKAMLFGLWVTITDLDLSVSTQSKLRQEVNRLFGLNSIKFYSQHLEISLEKNDSLPTI
jgi:small-conductance mechanosensitive channel